MYIGNLKISGKLFLAPMSNVTSLPFRLICKKYGAAMVYSEMINADSFIMESNKTLKRAYFLDEERPVGIQLMGSSKKKLLLAAKKIDKELKPDIIDINIGCPAYNVMKGGSGASLLKDKQKLADIVSSLSSIVSVPFTCKIRVLSDEEDTIRIAKTIQKSGAKALTVHGRTAKQKYSGQADWKIIKKIKEEVNIPVILNGDIKDEESAKKALDTTGVDALMIGRAAIGNPYIFKRIDYYLKTGKKIPKKNLSEKIEDFKEFMEFCYKYDYKNIASIKMQMHNFVKGVPGNSEIKNKITMIKTVEELYDFFTKRLEF